MSTQVNVSFQIPKHIKKELDDLVDKGIYTSRSAAMRTFLDVGLNFFKLAQLNEKCEKLELENNQLKKKLKNKKQENESE